MLTTAKKSLYIIGNGFDLAHGLKTSYNDFMFDYLKQALLDCSRRKPYNDELINLAQTHLYRLDAKDLITRYSNLNKLLGDISYQGIRLNFHSKFMELIINQCQITNWVDIENLYFTEIKRLSKIETQNEYLEGLKELNACLTALRNKLIDYLYRINSAIEIDFSSDQAEKFLDIFNKDYTGVTKQVEIIDDLVLNFNYTDTVSQYIRRLGRWNIKEIKIHGSLHRKDSIIFGYGDEMDDIIHDLEKKNDNLFFEHLKSFGYLKTSDYQKAMSFLDKPKNSINVYILGHSLGLSDRILLNQIFEHESISKIEIYYYKDENGKNDFVNKTFEISRHFKQKSLMRKIICPFSDSESIPQKNYSRP